MYANIMRLTKEVEVKKAVVNGEERSVLNNRVAISEGEDRTTFADITAWGMTAELMGKYLKKGNEFYGEGELKNKVFKYNQEDGTEKELQTVFLLISRMKFTYGNKKAEKEE